MPERVKQNLRRRDDNANVFQDGIPNTLVAPGINVVISAEEAKLVGRQVFFKEAGLLAAQRIGWS